MKQQPLSPWRSLSLSLSRESLFKHLHLHRILTHLSDSTWQRFGGKPVTLDPLIPRGNYLAGRGSREIIVVVRLSLRLSRGGGWHVALMIESFRFPLSAFIPPSAAAAASIPIRYYLPSKANARQQHHEDDDFVSNPCRGRGHRNVIIISIGKACRRRFLSMQQRVCITS